MERASSIECLVVEIHLRKRSGMRTSLITAAAIALVAMPVLAQGPGSSPMTPAPRNPSAMGGPPAAVPRPPMPNPLTQEDLSRVKGTDVYGTDDKKIGSINTVLMDPQSKTIDRLVVKAGGVLGVGGHDVAIPVDQFTWDRGKEGFKLSKTADELKAMPGWQAASSSASPSYGGTGSASPTGAAPSGAR
jgi:sporulation protein YlmC with PRC-barrel domain